VLQTRESYHNHEDVYKVGRTDQSCLGRFNNYPNGSQLFLHIGCVDGVSTENKILKTFNEMFTRCDTCKLYGNEYFKGDIGKMMSCILKEITGIHYDFSYMNNQHKQTRHLELQLKEANDNLQKQESYYKEKLTAVLNLNKKIISEAPENPIPPENHIPLETPIPHGNYPCESCPKTFQFKYSLRKHIPKCNGVSNLQCNICMKFFKSKHSKYHHKKKVICAPPPHPPPPPPPIWNLQPNTTNNINHVTINHIIHQDNI
jgi:hypothetical protein